MFLVVTNERREDAGKHLPANSLWVFAETGGKTVYVNQPPETTESARGIAREKCNILPFASMTSANRK